MAGRVVYVLRAFPEVTETFVRNEIRALGRLGVPVSVLAAWRSDPAAADWTAEDAAAVPVTYLAEQGSIEIPGARLAGMLGSDVAGLGPRHAARAFRLAAFAQAAVPHVAADAAILHAHFANDAAVLARYIGRLVDLPFRMTAHAYDLYQDPFLLDRNLRFASRILTISDANRVFLEGRLRRAKLEETPVEVLRCGVDLGTFDYRDPAPIGSPAALLCAARLVPKKGHERLLEAAAILQRANVPVTLELAGAGPLEEALRARAAREGLSAAVRFLGALPHDAVRARMRSVDVCVLAARVAGDGDRDGIPVALMEAMATGTPVVGTAVSGIPELIRPGTGRLAPPDDGPALASAIEETLVAPHAATVAQARAARARIESEFDLAAIARRLVP